MKMKAAVMYEAGSPMVIEELELEAPRAGEVMVKMVATGVCHSDVHYYTKDLTDRVFPAVLGHEGAGVVTEVGEGVKSVKAGDHVILTFLPSCGQCHWCHVGEPNICDLGAHLGTGRMLDGTTRMKRVSDGAEIYNFLLVSTFAEYTVVPEASLVPVASHLPLEKVCLFGCGFTTGFGAATNSVHIRPGESVTVVGCGGLGLAAIQGARASGAGMIIAVDVHEEKLAMAKKMGATHTLVYRRNLKAIENEINELTWGQGTNYSMEFVGGDQTDETMHIAFKAIGKGGTMLQVGVGQKTKKTVPIMPAELTLWQKSVKGVLFGDAQFRTDIPRYIDLFEKGTIDLDGMITEEMPLEDINRAFDNVVAGNKVARQIIRF